MYIKLNVATGAEKEVVKKTSDDYYDISVREPAKRNLANKKILEIMRRLYPNNIVRVVSGYHSPNKIISIEE